MTVKMDTRGVRTTERALFYLFIYLFFVACIPHILSQRWVQKCKVSCGQSASHRGSCFVETFAAQLITASFIKCSPSDKKMIVDASRRSNSSQRA